jgi:hypothetical protein
MTRPYFINALKQRSFSPALLITSKRIERKRVMEKPFHLDTCLNRFLV